MSSSIGMMIFPTEWKNKIHVPVTTNQDSIQWLQHLQPPEKDPKETKMADPKPRMILACRTNIIHDVAAHLNNLGYAWSYSWTEVLKTKI